MEWIEKIEERIRSNRKKRVMENAEQMFQITEYRHLLWFTYDGNLFAPCHLLGCDTADDAVALIETLRGMFVLRNTEEK